MYRLGPIVRTSRNGGSRFEGIYTSEALCNTVNLEERWDQVRWIDEVAITLARFLGEPQEMIDPGSNDLTRRKRCRKQRTWRKRANRFDGSMTYVSVGPDCENLKKWWIQVQMIQHVGSAV